MLIVAHSIIGIGAAVAVGTATHNPYLGFMAAILSHHIADALPHFDQGSFYTNDLKPNWLIGPRDENRKFNRRDWIILVADAVIAFSILIFFLVNFKVFRPLIVIGLFGGLTPDIIDSSPLWSYRLRHKSRILMAYHNFHSFFHWTLPAKYFSIGIITQIITVIFILRAGRF